MNVKESHKKKNAKKTKNQIVSKKNNKKVF